jgi:hypothetical protein
VDVKHATGPDRETLIAFFNGRLPQQYPAWQVETVREIRELLEPAASARQPVESSNVSAG